MIYRTKEELGAAFPAYFAREEDERNAPLNQYVGGWEG